MLCLSIYKSLCATDRKVRRGTLFNQNVIGKEAKEDVMWKMPFNLTERCCHGSLLSSKCTS